MRFTPKTRRQKLQIRRHRQSRQYHRPLRLEPLEARQLLSITVNTLADEADGSITDGDVSLRDAIALAPTGETIDFSVTGTINLSVGSSDFNRHLTINKGLTINGPGADLLAIRPFDPTPTIKNNDGSGVFEIWDGNLAQVSTVTISGLTLTGTDSNNQNGAIHNIRENLTIVDCAITGNSAAETGGGIYNFYGPLTVKNTTISHNAAPQGGGIFSRGADFTIIDSTISENTARNGAGIYSRTKLDGTATATIANSTISGNSASQRGGGINSHEGLLIIRNSTITDNAAPINYGGGLSTDARYHSVRTEVYSSIIAGNNHSDVDVIRPPSKVYQSNGYNLIGTGNAAIDFTAAGDQSGITNPLVGPLADNGGPTFTHALLVGSPAIDAGDPAAAVGVGQVPHYDQRGMPITRVFNGDGAGGARIDIGAFEMQPNSLLGDYNLNGIADAADYVQWRKTVNQSIDPYQGADGDGDGVIDQDDYGMWRVNFGNTAPMPIASTAALHAISSIPALNSLPSATAQLYLDFNGHFEPVWSNFTNVTTPVYSIDGDYTTFSDAELSELESIWARVAEDFAPFNINVTTVEPAVLAPGMPISAANGIALRVAIGGSSMDWFGQVGVNGVGNINAFTNSNANVVYVFSNNGSALPLGDTVSHEAGHGFGLQHQAGEDAPDGHWTSIMSRDDETASVWTNGTNVLGQSQDDMAVIAGTLNGFGYRQEDHGNTTGSATPLSFDGSTHSGAGLIETNNDVDYWSFSMAEADSYRIVVEPASVGPNLDVVLELRDAVGALVASANPMASLGAQIVVDLLAGSYFLSVAKTATYGLVGSYSIAISAPPAGITASTADPIIVKESGASAAFQLLLDSQPTADVTIPIASSNPVEGSVSVSSLIFTPANWNVPQSVTVTEVSDAAADGDATFSIVIGPSASADPHYDGLVAPDLAAVNIEASYSGFLIWADNENSLIKRSKLDGSNVVTVLDLKALYGPGNYSPRGVAVDAASGKMYWTEGPGRIQRANLDGTNVETLVSGLTGNGLRGGVALDVAAGKMYWGDAAARKIQRANLDGTGVQDLVTGATLSGVRDLVLDLTAGKMYWPDFEENDIRRANLDGSNIEILWTGVEYDGPIAIDLDLAAGKMYWADVARDQILRANLDGTAAEVVFDMEAIADGSAITGLALDARNGKVYWTDLQTYATYRANLDGSDVVKISSQAGIGVAIVAPAISVSPAAGLTTSESGGAATFKVTLTTPPNANVTVPIQSSNLQEGTVSTSSVTFTPLNWNVPQTVTIVGVNDAIDDGDISYSVILGAASSADTDYQGVNPRDVSVSNIDNDDPPAKFFVVDDGSANRTYKYQSTGASLGNYSLNSGNSAPRGAASTAAGEKTWVIDANRKVYVYSTSSGVLLGSWTAGTMASNATPEGIATNGTDVWIVDSRSDKVFKYSGAATRLSGSQNAASSFNLNSGNANAKDIVTNGSSLWVVNDSSTNKVFKYSIAGSLQGSWTISGANTTPTGITIDPANVSDIWIVDSGTDRVYQYIAAASRTAGSQSAAASFALAAGNTNPQGIADPPAPATAILTHRMNVGAIGMWEVSPKPERRFLKTPSTVAKAREQVFASFAPERNDALLAWLASRHSQQEKAAGEWSIRPDDPEEENANQDSSDESLDAAFAALAL